MTTDHRREHGGWEREPAYGADAVLGCLGCSLPLLACPGKMLARTSVALTCPSTTSRSLSTGISIPARTQRQHGGLRLRSMFRALICKVRCQACLKRRAGARILCTTASDAASLSMLLLVVLFSCYAASLRSANNNKQQCC